MIRIIHCVIFLRTTGYPPRSDNPLITSSLAKTVPKSAHQFTSASAKNVKRYFNNIACCSFSEKEFHSVAVNNVISSSAITFTFVFPSVENVSINLEIGSALSDVTS